MELLHKISDLFCNMTKEEYHKVVTSEGYDMINGSFTKEELIVALIKLVKKGE